MDLSKLRGLPRDQQFAAAAEFAGVSPDVLKGQWAAESNKGDPNWMTSPKGARGHFGLMPSTQATWAKRLGITVNPDDFTDSLFVASHQMQENMKAAGNVADALRMYNAGTDRSNWNNKETRGYVGKVLGTPQTDSTEAAYAAPASTASLLTRSIDEVLYGKKARETTHYNSQDYTSDLLSPTERAVRASGGTATRTVDRGIDQGTDAARAAEGQADFEAARLKSLTMGDKLEAAFRDTSLSVAGVYATERMLIPSDPQFDAWKTKNLDRIYKDAAGGADFNLLMRSGSAQEYETVLANGKQSDYDKQTYANTSGDALLYSLAGGLVDPTAIAATVMTGGAFKAAGIGGAAMLAEGRLGIGVASLAAEGGLGNMSVAAGLQVAGKPTTGADYASAAGIGMLLGATMTPFMYKGKVSTELVDNALAVRQDAAIQDAGLTARAQAELPPSASEDTINAKKVALEEEDKLAAIDANLSPVQRSQRIVPTKVEDTMTADPKVKEAVTKKYALDLVSDEAERGLSAEIIANSERIVAETVVNRKGLTKVSGVLPGAESTGMTLLKSDNPVANAIAIQLTENTTGAAGRRVTAASIKDMKLRQYMSKLFGYTDLMTMFRKGEGIPLADEFLGAKGSKAFNRRVFFEIHSREPGMTSTETNPAVIKMADHIEEGYQLMLDDQKTHGTAGNARLPDSAAGYFTRRMDIEKVVSLPKEARRAVAKEYSRQLQNVVHNGKEDSLYYWDEKFTDELGLKLLERATSKQAGMDQVPMNLHESEAADMVLDVLKAMEIPKEERHAFMGAMARGGAGHTKGRLKLDMFGTIPDGDGGTMKLGDLYSHDVSNIYRSYAKRVSGEVSLAQYGILGTKGIKTLRAAMQHAYQGTEGANVKELAAFDQIAAEFMGFSFGKRSQALDNLSVVTTAARLGSAVVNQLGDLANGSLAVGIHRSFAVVKELPALLHDVVTNVSKGKPSNNPILRSLDANGLLGMDDYQLQPMFGGQENMVDIYGKNNVGHFTQIAKRGAEAQYILTGHRALVAAQTRGMSEQIIRKMVAYISKGREDVALADMGLTPAMREAIKTNLPYIAKFDARGKLVHLDIEAGKLTVAQKVELRSIIDRGASQIVQRTYIGETGPWAHDSMLGLLYKFRTYSLTAMEKQWSRNTMNHGHLIAFAQLAGAMSWAIPIHIARVEAKSLGLGSDKRQEFLDKNLSVFAMAKATANYAAAAGLAPDIAEVGAAMYGNYGGEDGKTFAKASGSGRGDLVGGLVAPPLDVLNDAYKGVIQHDPKKLLKLLPGSNTLPAQVLFNYFGNDE